LEFFKSGDQNRLQIAMLILKSLLATLRRDSNNITSIEDAATELEIGWRKRHIIVVSGYGTKSKM